MSGESSRTGAIALGRKVVAAASIVVGLIGGAFVLDNEFTDRFGEPIEVRVEQLQNDACSGWVFRASPEQLGDVPPVEATGEFDRQRWAAERGAVNAYLSTVSVTVRGATDRAVELEGLDVHVVARESPIVGTHVAEQCGDAVDQRFLFAELTIDDPVVESLDERLVAEPYGDEPKDPLQFPFQVDQGEIEQFLLTVTAPSCYCTWVARLRWNDGDRSGYTLLLDGRQPFMVSGTDQATRAGNYQGGPLQTFD